MSRQTELLIKPSIEEVLNHAKLIDLPAGQAHQFFAYYQSNGWKVGKNPMKCWKSAMAGWKSRWEDRVKERGQPREVPLGIQAQAIEKVLASHRGNLERASAVAPTSAERQEYIALKKKLAGIYRQIAGL